MGLGWVEDRLGVKADWHLFGGGPAIVEALDRGEVDIGYVGLPPVIIGIDRGAKIKCIAGGHVEGTVFLAGKAFKSLEELGSIRGVLEQLKGMGIGVPPRGSIHDVILRGLIQEEGIEGEIAIRNYPWADFVLEAMLDGEVDAAVGTPALAVASSQAIGARILIPPNKIWPNNPSYGIITSNKQIEENPKTLEGFLRLHEEASNLIRSDPKKAARIVSEAVKIVDGNFVLETYKISPKYCASLSKGFIKASLAFIPLLKKLKYISRTLKEEDIFDPRLIEKIHPEAPHYEEPKIGRFNP